MTPPTPLPRFVYKIVPAAPPEPIPEQFPPSDLDKQDGFIHLSIGSQIPHTAKLFFTDALELWVIKIHLGENLVGLMNWDVPNCPHLYSNFGVADVDSVRKFERPPRKTWTCEGVMDMVWLE